MTNAEDVIKKIVRTQVRNDLYSFIWRSFSIAMPGYSFLGNWHLEMIADALTKCLNGDRNRLIINLPPRYLKSFCTSVSFPAWLLGIDPKQRIIVSSYSGALSKKHASGCRTIMKSNWYNSIFPNSQIATGSDTKERFGTNEKGYYFATSIGGTLLGDGGSVLIVDDPQTPDSVLSKKRRRQVIDWFQTSLMSRLDNKKKGVIIIVMQRLHPNDLSGYLLENEPEKWFHISFPAIATKECKMMIGNKVYCTRKENDVIHHQRESFLDLQSLLSTIGTYAFQAQYQQKPILTDGGLIKIAWLSYYSKSEVCDCKELYFSIDCAKSSTETSDYSVISVIGKGAQGDHFLIDIQRGKYSYPVLRKKVYEMINKYKPIAILIEDASNGSSLIQELQFNGCQGIISIKPKGDKVARFNHALIAIESGRFLIPSKEIFISDFITELLSFPNSSHDDQVDTISQYFSWIYSRFSSINVKPQVRIV